MTFSSTIARNTTTLTVIYILVFSSLFSFPVGKFTRAERRRSCRPANGMFLEEKMCLSRSCGRGKSEVPPTDAKIAKLLNRILWDRLFLLSFNTFFDLMRSKKAAAKEEEEELAFFAKTGEEERQGEAEEEKGQGGGFLGRIFSLSLFFSYYGLQKFK